MAFRFQKRIKILPGVHLNFSKSGVSTSFGSRGATINVNSKGVRTTVGIPGSGMSWSRQSGWINKSSLKPTDELMQLGSMLDRMTKEFNSLSPKTNKISASLNKAVSTFEGGRGPSQAKFQTLSKRYETAVAGYQKIDDKITEHTEILTAVGDRIKTLKFGIFSGSYKRVQRELLKLVGEHELGARKLGEAIKRLCGEISEELDAAQNSF